MVLLEMAVEAVDGLGTCVLCVDVDVTFRGSPLFRSGATGEVSMSLKDVKAEVCPRAESDLRVSLLDNGLVNPYSDTVLVTSFSPGSSTCASRVRWLNSSLLR
ncbi:hypothetical protein TNCV_1049181 [Trichonephila clavipes]|nr:hypothetical protein TNCV_1049181 [Trichonephila clavipes]